LRIEKRFLFLSIKYLSCNPFSYSILEAEAVHVARFKLNTMFAAFFELPANDHYNAGLRVASRAISLDDAIFRLQSFGKEPQNLAPSSFLRGKAAVC